MEKISDWFYRLSSIPVALAGLLIFVLFSVLTLPGQNELTAEYSNGTGAPDTSLFYDAKTIYAMAGAYGEEGRAAYLNARWTFDLAFPFVYTIFYITSISWLLARGVKTSSWVRKLNLLPLFAFVFDLLENTASSVVMAAYPAHNRLAETAAVVFTPVKWLFVASCMLLILVGIFLAGRAKMTTKA